MTFRSDLFHKTRDCRFREGYVNKRINVSLLFGYRSANARARLASAASSYQHQETAWVLAPIFFEQRVISSAGCRTRIAVFGQSRTCRFFGLTCLRLSQSQIKATDNRVRQ